MTFQDLLEKLKRYPVPSISGLILLVCAANFGLRMDLLTALAARFDTASSQGRQMDMNVAAGANIENHVEQMKAMVGQLENRIIRASEIAAHQAYFYRLESETGVVLADLRKKEAVPPTKGAAPTVYTPVGYTVTVSGKFPQLVAFLDELEHGYHLFRLRSLIVQRGREGETDALTLALNLELLGVP